MRVWGSFYAQNLRYHLEIFSCVLNDISSLAHRNSPKFAQIIHLIAIQLSGKFKENLPFKTLDFEVFIWNRLVESPSGAIWKHDKIGTRETKITINIRYRDHKLWRALSLSDSQTWFNGIQGHNIESVLPFSLLIKFKVCIYSILR